MLSGRPTGTTPFAGTDVSYGHVLGFKGLERTAVVLAVNQIERVGGEAVRRRLHDAAEWSPGRFA